MMFFVLSELIRYCVIQNRHFSSVCTHKCVTTEGQLSSVLIKKTHLQYEVSFICIATQTIN